MFTLREDPSTEFRGDSCCDNKIGWGAHICKVLQVCIITHSKTPISVHVTVLIKGLGTGVGWGWGAGLFTTRADYLQPGGTIYNWPPRRGQFTTAGKTTSLHKRSIRVAELDVSSLPAGGDTLQGRQL